MRRRGFTFIELMIVIAILGILAAVIIPKVEEVKIRAELKKKGFDSAQIDEWAKATGKNVFDLADEKNLNDFESGQWDRPKKKEASSGAAVKFCPYCGHAL